MNKELKSHLIHEMPQGDDHQDMHSRFSASVYIICCGMAIAVVVLLFWGYSKWNFNHASDDLLPWEKAKHDKENEKPNRGLLLKSSLK